MCRQSESSFSDENEFQVEQNEQLTSEYFGKLDNQKNKGQYNVVFTFSITISDVVCIEKMPEKSYFSSAHSPDRKI